MLEVFQNGINGPDVLFVHGDILDASMLWPAQAPLAANFRLRMVNRRGFGNSPDVAGEDFEVDANDVAGLLADDGTHLVGHSHGAVIAMLAAARRPDRVRSLTVCEPPAFGLTRGTAAAEEFISGFEEIAKPDSEADDFLPRFIRLVGGDPSASPSPAPPPLAKACSVLINGRWPWEADIPLDALEAAPFPIMAISGGHSRLFDDVIDILRDRTGASVEVIPGAGHTVPMLGEPFNAALERFWSEAEASRPPAN